MGEGGEVSTTFTAGPLNHRKDYKSFDHRFVGLFDFLGVKKALYDGVTAEKLVECFDPIFQEARDPATFSKERGPNMPKPHFFSDSILLWSGGTEDYDDFTLQARKLMALAILSGVPIRGGIAFGECYIDHNQGIFIGKPLMDAYDTERSQDWLGAALHQSVVDIQKFMPEGLTILEENNCIVKYPVPIKEGCAIALSGYALQYYCGGRKKALDAVASMKKIAGQQFDKYYDNTLAFLNTHGLDGPCCVGDWNFIPLPDKPADASETPDED